jgi:hypothetical protein
MIVVMTFKRIINYILSGSTTITKTLKKKEVSSLFLFNSLISLISLIFKILNANSAYKFQ